jgi:hypothetical protein
MSMPSGITLDGGCRQSPDGTWTVGCMFTNIASQGEAEMLSAWLERIVSIRLHEVAEVMSVEVHPATGLQ